MLHLSRFFPSLSLSLFDLDLACAHNPCVANRPVYHNDQLAFKLERPQLLGIITRRSRYISHRLDGCLELECVALSLILTLTFFF